MKIDPRLLLTKIGCLIIGHSLSSFVVKLNIIYLGIKNPNDVKLLEIYFLYKSVYIESLGSPRNTFYCPQLIP